MLTLVKNLSEMPYLMDAKNLQQLGFSRDAAYHILNLDDAPVLKCGRRKLIYRDRFGALLERIIMQKIEL